MVVSEHYSIFTDTGVNNFYTKASFTSHICTPIRCVWRKVDCFWLKCDRDFRNCSKHFWLLAFPE